MFEPMRRQDRALAPEEAERCLTALLKQYSPDHLEAGKTYIQWAKAKTCVLRIVIRHMTGKARRQP